MAHCFKNKQKKTHSVVQSQVMFFSIAIYIIIIFLLQKLWLAGKKVDIGFDP